MSVCAIIAAAGRGRRMEQSIFKQFLEIENKPILVHTLEKFSQCELIDSIIIVVPKDRRRYVKEKIIDSYQITKVDKILVGGETRQHSIYEAIKILDEHCATVVIHDAVRPFITLALLSKVITRGQQTGAAILAVPARDSIIKVIDSQVERTLDRNSVWLVQTPQAYNRDLIFHAYQQAFFDGITATDDSELVRYLNHPIEVVASSQSNIKITTAEDLDLADCLMRIRKKFRR